METGKITAGKAYIEVLKQNIVTAQKKAEEQKKWLNPPSLKSRLPLPV